MDGYGFVSVVERSGDVSGDVSGVCDYCRG